MGSAKGTSDCFVKSVDRLTGSLSLAAVTQVYVLIQSQVFVTLLFHLLNEFRTDAVAPQPNQLLDRHFIVTELLELFDELCADAVIPHSP